MFDADAFPPKGAVIHLTLRDRHAAPLQGGMQIVDADSEGITVRWNRPTEMEYRYVPWAEIMALSWRTPK